MEKEQLTALVRKSQSGDAAAMEKLLQYAHTSVSYQCRKMLNNAQDAEDMTQEVLVTIYTKLDTLQEPAAFHKWVNQITASRCINALNRTHVEYQFAEDEEGHSILDTLEELDEQMIPDKAIDNAETVRMIEEIVDGLPDAQRAATLMFYYNEMSVKEIAQTMGVSENTVKSRLNYARKAIKERVLDYEKQGIKLYGLSPLPFLLYFLRLAAQNSADKEAAGVMVAEILAAESAAAAVAAAGAGSATAAAGMTAAAGGAATAAGTGAATGIFAGISAKVVASILAAVVTVGSVAAVVIPNTHSEATEPSTLSTEAISVTESTGHETTPNTEVPEAEAPTEEMTEAPTEESTEAPTEENTEAPTEESTEAPAEENTEAPTQTPETENNETVHQHSYECTVTTPPTCSNPGEATYTCACGDSYTEVVPKNEHVWSEWVVTIEPTTTAYGKKVRTCSLCYGAQEVSIDPITVEEGHEHSYTAHVMAPTCEEKGYTTYTCSCGHTYTGDETAPTGHTFETKTIPPTTDTQGYDLHTCTKCGLDYVDNFTDPLPAEETEPAETEASTVSEHTCDYVVTEYVAHTCTTGGYTTVTCTICGDTQTQYRVAMGHNFVDGVCSYCGVTEGDYQATCEHHYDGGQEIWPAGTMTWEPYILYTCTLCGHTYTELIDYLS